MQMFENLNEATQKEIVRMTGLIAARLGYDAANNVIPDIIKEKCPDCCSLEKFSENMNIYIAENVESYMARGLEENDALIATQQKLSGEGFAKSLNEFYLKYGGGKEMQKPNISRNAGNAPARRAPQKMVLNVIPMLYLAFLLIGLGFGLMVGKIVGMVAIGLLSGAIIGLGLGLVTHAVVMLEEKK